MLNKKLCFSVIALVDWHGEFYQQSNLERGIFAMKIAIVEKPKMLYLPYWRSIKKAAETAAN